MSIEIPADWPDRSWVEDTPIGHLETLASTAPSGTVPTRWSVASWESTREIASSSLPGQVRHKTGLSVGTGKALVKRQPDDFPWRQRDVYDLSGSAAEILIAPELATKIPTGQFRVADTEGDLTTIGVTVDLDERQIEGRDKAPGVLGEQYVSAIQFQDAAFDPAWWISELAHQMGYGVSATPNQNGYIPILDAPLQGTLAPAWPRGIDFRMQSGSPVWGELDDRVALIDRQTPSTNTQYTRYAIERVIAPLSIHTLTFDALDRAQFQWIRSDQTTVGYINLSVEDVRVGVNEATQFTLRMSSVGLNGVANTNTVLVVNSPYAADRPYGVQVQVEFTDAGTNWASARFRGRRGAGAAWSAWSAAHTFTNAIADTTREFNFWVRPRRLSASEARLARVSLVDALNTWTPDQLWAAQDPGQQGRLYLEPLFGTNQSPWLDPDKGALTLMQEIAEAWQGALITDVYGDLRLMNRFSLSGVGTGSEIPINIGTKFEDLPWVMSYTDQADRLVVKYRPVVVREWAGLPDVAPTIWELDRVVPMYPGGNNLFFTLDYVYPVDLKLIPFVRKDSDDGVRHVWDAYRYNNGTGAHMDPNVDIAMRIDRVTASTWKVFIDNRTASPFHMVDNTGTPWLKIRSTYYLDQTQEAIVERGLSSDDAQNALEVDVSNYVQNATDADTLIDFLWARVNRRTWRAKTVNAVPDYRLDLGDVVEIAHERTKVRSNALVTKVKLAGDPGQVTQLLDLVLIPSTWEDFDEAWAAYQPSPPGSWAEFDALWTGETWDDFDRTPTATTQAQINEGM